MLPYQVGYIIMTSDKAGGTRKFESKERNRNKPGVVLCGSMDYVPATSDPEVKRLPKTWDEDILLGCILGVKMPTQVQLSEMDVKNS